VLKKLMIPEKYLRLAPCLTMAGCGPHAQPIDVDCLPLGHIVVNRLLPCIVRGSLDSALTSERPGPGFCAATRSEREA
jgi:hypothetical protein